jgi:hypothetical protein
MATQHEGTGANAYLIQLNKRVDGTVEGFCVLVESCFVSRAYFPWNYLQQESDRLRSA